MHPDLSPHLHTQECNQLSEKLQQCHNEKRFMKFLGACNEPYNALIRCLKNEREQKRRSNRRINEPKT